MVVFMTQVSRMSGGAKPKLGWGLDQWLYAIPYALVVWFATTTLPSTFWAFNHISELTFQGITISLAYFGAFFGKRTGHGTWIGLPFVARRWKDREWGDSILDLFFGEDPRYFTDSTLTVAKDIKNYGETKIYLRNLAGLALNGIFPSFMAGLALLIMGYWVGALALIVLSSFKWAAYDIPWRIWPSGKAPWAVNYKAPDYKYKFFRDEFCEATQFGEAITGTLAALGLIATVLNILGVI